jgi:fructose-1,6-bisphosphatase
VLCLPFPANFRQISIPALQQERQGHIDTELATVISSISLACKQIAAAVGRSGISSLTGIAGTGENVQVGSVCPAE